MLTSTYGRNARKVLVSVSLAAVAASCSRSPRTQEADDGASNSSARIADMATAGQGCSLTGRWRGRTVDGKSAYAGKPLTVLVRGDGTAQWALPGAVFSSEASIRSGTVELLDRSSSPANLQCPPVVGSYRAEWSADCRTLTLRLISDSCDERAQATNGLRLERIRASGE